MARTLPTIAFACLLLVWHNGRGLAAETVLPHGSAPPPLVARHFPNRVYEFVWRNWNVVEPSRMAELLGASKADIVALAESMGLPPAAPISVWQKKRGYLTLIRRNWHLLPYEQLLELAEMTPERLSLILREEDFMWSKLGKLKPNCPPLRYAPPDESARRRAAEIRQILQEEFGLDALAGGEPRFRFFDEFYRSASNSRRLPPQSAPQDGALKLRMIYPYCAPYCDPLIDENNDPCPEGLLEKLADAKINAVWLHVMLRNLAPGGKKYPEFGVGAEKRLANLQAIVQRAKKYGIGVYLYLNEPRSMPPAFFRGREELAGVSGGSRSTALCTSHPEVRRWMSDALAHLFRSVPDLAGVFTITASENLTNCASYGNWKSCPRCKNRSDAEIIAEVNATIAEGVHRGNPKANVIAWDWGWRGHGDGSEIIALLPKNVWLMSVSEWALPIERGGVKLKIGEYSLSAVGPGPRATRHWELARQAGLKTVAKVQVNNSWELASLPYLPVMDLVAEHCHNLASLGVDGMMLSWSLGGYPSPNLDIAARFAVQPTPTVDEVLEAAAVERYGAEAAPLARRAWTAFSRAFREYPHYVNVVYCGPVQLGPANPLYPHKTGYRATMVGFPYDHLNLWRGPYPAETFAEQYGKMAAGWRAGLVPLRKALEKVPPGRRNAAGDDLRFAQAAAIHFQSVANQVRFIQARDELAKNKKTLSADQKRILQDEQRRCLRSEIALARELFDLAKEDSRIGFEASNHYLYLPLDLAEKVINCRWLLDQLTQ